MPHPDLSDCPEIPKSQETPTVLANWDGQSPVLATGLGFESKTGHLPPEPPPQHHPAFSIPLHLPLLNSSALVPRVPRECPVPRLLQISPMPSDVLALPLAPYLPLSSGGKRDKSNSYGRFSTGSVQPRPPPAGFSWPGQIKG